MRKKRKHSPRTRTCIDNIGYAAVVARPKRGPISPSLPSLSRRVLTTTLDTSLQTGQRPKLFPWLDAVTFFSSLMAFMRRLSLPSASPNCSCKKSEYDIGAEAVGLLLVLMFSRLCFSWGTAGCRSIDDDERLPQGDSGEGGHCLRRERVRGRGGGGGKKCTRRKVYLAGREGGRIGTDPGITVAIAQNRVGVRHISMLLLRRS